MKFVRFGLALLICAVCAAACGEPAVQRPVTTPTMTASMAKPPKLRLPGTVTPHRAAVTLELVPKADAIEGAIDLELTFNESTDLLWLNATELEIREAHLDVSGAKI